MGCRSVSDGLLDVVAVNPSCCSGHCCLGTCSDRGPKNVAERSSWGWSDWGWKGSKTVFFVFLSQLGHHWPYSHGLRAAWRTDSHSATRSKFGPHCPCTHVLCAAWRIYSHSVTRG